MKKRILKITLGVCALALVGFTTSNYVTKKSTAEVEQMEGVYLFVDSKPVTEYEYLGTVKISFAWDSQYTGVRDKLIKKGKKDFPNADGFILQFKSGGQDKCDAIKFK